MPPESRASAVGFVNVFAYVVGSLAPLLFGFLSHRWGVRGFEIGFAGMGVLLLVGALALSVSCAFLFNRYRISKE